MAEQSGDGVAYLINRRLSARCPHDTPRRIRACLVHVAVAAALELEDADCSYAGPLDSVLHPPTLERAALTGADGACHHVLARVWPARPP